MSVNVKASGKVKTLSRIMVHSCGLLKDCFCSLDISFIANFTATTVSSFVSLPCLALQPGADILALNAEQTSGPKVCFSNAKRKFR